MKIAVIADAHANVIALEKVLAEIKKEGVDTIYHLGDSINLVPFPKETAELLLRVPHMKCIMGDHDARFLNNLEGYIPKVAGEKEHYEWSHAQLNSLIKEKVEEWPYIVHESYDNIRLSFAHYGLTHEENQFLPIVYEPKIADADSYFERYNTNLFFFGHTHKIFNSFGKSHYINPGAVGVNNRGHIPYLVVEINDHESYKVTQYQIPYDIEPVIRAFHQRNVPNKEQIIKIFYQ